MFKRFSILLSIIGLGIITYVVATAKREIPSPPPAAPPSVNPFPRGIAGLGVVETAGRETDVAAPEPGRIVEVFVQVGDKVQQGDALFRLDDTALRAEVLRATAARDAAAAELARMESWPRPEDIPPLRAALDEATTRLRDAEDRYEKLSAAAQRGAATPEETDRQRFAVETARAAAAVAQANLDRYIAGPWKADVDVARAALQQRSSELEAVQMRADNLTVRAPRAASVLKRNIEPGEYFASGSIDPAPVVLGDLDRLHIRAQIDEEDVTQLRLGAEGRARVRGLDAREIALKMLRIEPLALPKSQITNSNTELIDTRVIEVLFEVLPGERPPLYPGQVVDVFIAAPEAPQE